MEIFPVLVKVHFQYLLGKSAFWMIDFALYDPLRVCATTKGGRISLYKKFLGFLKKLQNFFLIYGTSYGFTDQRSLNILVNRKILVCNIRKCYRILLLILSNESNLWYSNDLRENRSSLTLIDKFTLNQKQNFKTMPFSKELVGCPLNLLEIGKIFRS